MGHEGVVVSYLTLRRLIGIVAILHPIILFAGGYFIFGLGLQPSMSDYYWTGMRDVFVGIDVSTGVFFLCYRGYDLADRLAAYAAGLGAILVALFPTVPLHVPELSQAQIYTGIVHAAGAGLFLVSIAYFCLVLFVKSHANQPLSSAKRMCNRFYRIAGSIILVSIALIMAYVLFEPAKTALAPYNFIFWLELIAFWAFGLAWLVKGKALFSADK